jgi:hypothetical protein
MAQSYYLIDPDTDELIFPKPFTGKDVEQAATKVACRLFTIQKTKNR